MIIKLIYCLARKPHLTREQFHDYWLNRHAAKVRSVRGVIGMTGYVQNHTIENGMSDAMRDSRGGNPPYDGVMEGWIDTGTGDHYGTTEEYVEAAKMLLDDEGEFIDFSRSVIMITAEHIIF